MSTFAVVKNNVIENIIEADAQAIAEALLPGFDIMEAQPELGIAAIGGTIVNGKFVLPKPYESWIFDENSSVWTAPISAPEVAEGSFPTWNEDELKWDILTIPTTE